MVSLTPFIVVEICHDDKYEYVIMERRLGPMTSGVGCHRLGRLLVRLLVPPRLCGQHEEVQFVSMEVLRDVTIG